MIHHRGRPSRIGVALVVLFACAPRLNAQSEDRRWLLDPILLATIEDRDGTLFGNPQEVVALPDAGFALLDREVGRATIIDGRTGDMITDFPVPAGASQILPSSGSGRVLVAPESGKDETLWLSISEEGRVLESADMPVACGSNLACEHQTTVTGGLGAAITFRWSSKMVFLNPDGSVRQVTEGFGSPAFPDVNTEDVMAPRRVVDAYAVATGDYRGSFLFPNDLEGLAILSDGRLATLDLEFFPTVQVWEVVW